jgi:methyl-accepting chemotaxis protein
MAGHEQELYSGAPQAEQDGIQLALQGVPFQSFSIPPEDSDTAAKISFMAPVKNAQGQVQGVLIGRADLESNPFSQPIIDSLVSISAADGSGLLLDETGLILYHPDTQQLMQAYPGRRSDQDDFYDSVAPDGTRTLVYYRPALGRPWAVVLSVPAQRAQQLALDIAAPLLGMILFLSLISIILLRITLGVVTSSLKRLSAQAENITRGDLDGALQVSGEDEVAVLSRAFEKMRISLRERLDELSGWC